MDSGTRMNQSSIKQGVRKSKSNWSVSQASIRKNPQKSTVLIVFFSFKHLLGDDEVKGLNPARPSISSASSDFLNQEPILKKILA